jgi:hypothetical protein
MKQLFEFPLEHHGSSITVEIEEAGTEQGVDRAGLGDQVIKRATQSFEAALDKMKPVVNAVMSKLQELTSSMDEVGLEFGLKMSAKAGIVLAAGDVEANFKVSLKWKK